MYVQTNYFKHSDNANCIEDLDTILTKIPSTSTENVSYLFSNKTSFNFKKPTLQVGTVDYRSLSLPDQNSFSVPTFVGILWKCLSQHSCDICLEYARTQTDLEPSFVLSYLNAYTNKENSTFRNLMMPHNDFYNYIFELETGFVKLFPTLSIETGVRSKN